MKHGSQTFAYQASANRTFAHRFSPITHLPIKTYAYQKLNLKSGLLPIRVGLLPIKNWSTSVNIFVYVYIVCTLQNLNGETKKGKLFEKEVNHTDLLNTKEFLKSCSASNLYGEVLKMSHMNYKYMYVLVKLSRLYVRPRVRLNLFHFAVKAKGERLAHSDSLSTSTVNWMKWVGWEGPRKIMNVTIHKVCIQSLIHNHRSIRWADGR